MNERHKTKPTEEGAPSRANPRHASILAANAPFRSLRATASMGKAPGDSRPPKEAGPRAENGVSVLSAIFDRLGRNRVIHLRSARAESRPLRNWRVPSLSEVRAGWRKNCGRDEHCDVQIPLKFEDAAWLRRFKGVGAIG